MAKILMVDDDEVVVAAYRNKLMQAGFDVEVAFDGLNAMKMLHAYRPDVVVLDMMLPKFSGLEVLKYIRSEVSFRKIRVVILSNMYVGGEQREIAGLEADKAFAKSDCTPALLIQAIHEVLAASPAQSSSESLPTPPGGVDRRLPS